MRLRIVLIFGLYHALILNSQAANAQFFQRRESCYSIYDCLQKMYDQRQQDQYDLEQRLREERARRHRECVREKFLTNSPYLCSY